MKIRTLLLAAMLVVTSLARAGAPDRSGAHGFDFLFGDWSVHHRLKRASGEWWEFDATCSNRALMGGASNVEEHIFTKPSGTTYGVALRTYAPGIVTTSGSVVDTPVVVDNRRISPSWLNVRRSYTRSNCPSGSGVGTVTTAVADLSSIVALMPA